MRVFGIDPGSLTTGYGVVEKRGAALFHVDNGIVKPKKDDPFHKRLSRIYDDIIKLLDEFKPDIVAIEDAFCHLDARAAIKLGHVRGIAMLAAVTKGLDIAEYAPGSIKQAVTGFGHATKPQVQQMVKAILKLPDVAAEDASDALAVAICHLNSEGMRRILEKKK